MEISGIYGIPGGLCLAVALSHRLDTTSRETCKNSLIVDDIFETGITLSNFKHIEGVNFFILVSKKKPIWWNTVNLSLKKNELSFHGKTKKMKLEKKQNTKKKSLK